MGAKQTKKDEEEQAPPPFEGAPTTDDLAKIMENKDYADVKAAGGLEAIAKSLRSDLKKGLTETPDELQKRRA